MSEFIILFIIFQHLSLRCLYNTQAHVEWTCDITHRDAIACILAEHQKMDYSEQKDKPRPGNTL